MARRVSIGRAPTPRFRVFVLSWLLGLIGAAGFVVVVLHLEPRVSPFTIGLPLFALLYFAAESKVVDVHFRGGTHTFSLTEVPAVIGLFFVSPLEYVVGILVGAAAALVLARQPSAKIAFNLSQFLLGAVASVTVFHVVTGLAAASTSPGLFDWLAAFAAMLTASTVSAVSISTVVTLAGRKRQLARLPEAIQVGSLFAVTNTALALLVVEIMWVKPEAVWLVGVPVVTLFIAYRAYLSERQKHASLELLYESSQIFQRSPELDSAIVALLDHARVMFGTDLAEIILAGGADGVPLRSAAGPGNHSEMMVPAPERAALLAMLESDPRPTIIHDRAGLPASSERLFRVAMVSPLMSESTIVGAMLVADRLGENDEFGPDNLRMLETVANQAAVALENGQLEQSLAELSRLKEELKHQAFHDALTGLANRAMFVEALEERMTSAGSAPGRPAPIVMFLDIDDFKIVNDTIGHEAGDRVLREVATRLAAAVGSGDLAARLGGDEFAVLLADGSDVRRASAIAHRIAASLQLPIQLRERIFDIGASLGMAEGHAVTSADELLRNADIAMYAAKAKGKRQLAIWSPEMHETVVERHTLTAEVARAVETGDIHVAYQPIVALGDGRVIGFEALARWDHPTRGAVEPTLFIRVAEESGAIVELGRSIIAEACREAAGWAHVPGFESMTVSVNLSARQVHEAGFADEVLAILHDVGLDPRRLVLEMTETAIFGDTDAAIAKLQALRVHGVRIAIDDFGTGYSSLHWLRRFPVDMIKLAREFMVDDDREGEWEFARAIVMMGRALGLRIVAEGIETPRQHARLKSLGSDYGQGFLYGRAVPPVELARSVALIEARRSTEQATVGRIPIAAAAAQTGALPG